ncbi:MAG TPA: lysylphosphatidylglycerol synthase domain-containing protein, partial [Thermomicrobiales bacterium]|nr:lysylphosphatidylglycerol synthase domain-containing protein [Thermomicrobiales bacterium]
KVPDRTRIAGWVAGVVFGLVVLTASIVFILRLGLDPWTWFGEVWVLIATIPAPFVIAACALKAAEVSLNAAAWTTVLRAAYPEQGIGFRQALGVVQGGVGIFAVIPPKFGGFAVLGLYRVAFPRLSITAVLATRVVQGISSTILGTAVLVIFGVATAGFGQQSGFVDRVTAFYANRPLIAIPLTIVVVALLVALLRYSREWLRGFATQLALGGAILRTPGRYVLLVAFPTLLAFVLRWGVTGTLLLAFGIRPSLETLVRVNVSHGLARYVQVMPGGLGTTQAFDLVALQGIAPVEVITAYSLAQVAILLVFNIAFGLVALTWAFGWSRTARLVRLPGRSAPVGPAAVAPQPGVG